jgi:Ca2+/Na+ antiporter
MWQAYWNLKFPFAIVTLMKILLKVMLLALFAVIVFIPNDMIASWAYWSLFLVMFLILYLYYQFTYYVSEKDVNKKTTETYNFSMYCAKVPPMSSEDLIRGRCIVTDTHFELYQKGVKSNEHVTLVWSRKISDVALIETGKVVGLRHGLIFTLKDGKKDSFAVFGASKIYDSLISTLGWKDV